MLSLCFMDFTVGVGDFVIGTRMLKCKIICICNAFCKA